MTNAPCPSPRAQRPTISGWRVILTATTIVQYYLEFESMLQVIVIGLPPLTTPTQYYESG